MQLEAVDWCLFSALAGIIIGSKLFFVFEIWARIWIVDIGFWDTFYHVFFTWNGMQHAGGEGMWKHLFSGSGLVFYGGLLFATAFYYLYTKKRKLAFLPYADVMCIGLSLSYGIGRLGCFVSGDGCFGHAANLNLPLLTWVYGPEDGNCPQDPALSWKYPYLCTDGVRVWNTPLIEALASFGLFAFYMLWARFQKFRPGMLAAMFLLWNGLIRFGVEFIRLNDALIPIFDPPQYTQPGSSTSQVLQHAILEKSQVSSDSIYFVHWHWYGFTQAQCIALILVGIAGLWIISLVRSGRKASKAV